MIHRTSWLTCLAVAVGAIALVAGTVMPASAGITGTTFTYLAENFQTTGAGLVTFGTPTAVAGTGMTVSSMVRPGLSGGDFVDIWLDTDNGGPLTGDLNTAGGFLVEGLNWGPDAPPRYASGSVYLYWTINGDPQPMSDAFGIIAGTDGVDLLPHPLDGIQSLAIDVDGDSVDSLPFTTELAVPGATLANFLALVGIFNAAEINDMHVGFEAVIPEPSALVLLGLGLVGVVAFGRRRFRR